MSVHYNKQSLNEKHQKQAEKQKLRELPGMVATLEDALCEQDAAADERMSTLEDALCELDAAVAAAANNQ